MTVISSTPRLLKDFLPRGIGVVLSYNSGIAYIELGKWASGQ